MRADDIMSPSDDNGKGKRTIVAVVAALFVCVAVYSFAVRYMRITNHFPYAPLVDEARSADNALRMLKTGDMNPHFFHYPPFLTYLCFGVDVLHYGYLMTRTADEPAYLNRLSEVDYASDFATGEQRAIFPSPTFYVWNRFAVAVLGTLTVLLLFLAGRSAFDLRVALLGAGVLGGAGFHIANSVTITPNAPFTFWIAAVLLFSLRYVRTKEFQSIVWALACVGLGTATKYNAGVAILIPAAAYLLYTPRREVFVQRRARLLLFLVAPAAAFLLCCPHAVLDMPKFLADVGAEMRHYKVLGHRGATETPGVAHFLSQMGRMQRQLGPWAFWSALAGIGCTLFRWPRLGVVLLTFPVVYMAYMCSQKVGFHRNFLPMYLYLSLFAGIFWVSLADGVSYLLKRSDRSARHAALGGVVVLLGCAVPLAPNLERQYAISSRQHNFRDTRTLAVEAVRDLCLDSPDAPCRVAVAAELRVHRRDMMRLGGAYVTLPAESLPASAHLFDYVITAQQFEHLPFATLSGFDSARVEVVETISRPKDERRAMRNGVMVDPTVVVLKSRAEHVLGPNLVGEGGFEGAYAKIVYSDGIRGALPEEGGWSIPQWSSAAMKVAKESSDVYAGASSVRLTRLTGGQVNTSLAYSFQERLEQGAWYQLQFAMKVVAGSGPTKMKLIGAGSKPGHSLYDSQSDAADRTHVPVDRVWKVYTYTFPAGTAALEILFGWGYYEKFDVLLDEVSLRKLSPGVP